MYTEQVYKLKMVMLFDISSTTHLRTHIYGDTHTHTHTHTHRHAHTQRQCVCVCVCMCVCERVVLCGNKILLDSGLSRIY